MRQNGILVVRTRKHKVTTDSDHKFDIAPNMLDRDFMANAPNQKWAGDISYLWTREGWLYLAVILEAPTRTWLQGIYERKGHFLSYSSSRDVLQNHKSKADLAKIVANAQGSGIGHLPLHQWLLQSASAALSNGLEKPGPLRTKSDLNEHLGRH